MIGTNIIQLNEATMIQALQQWLDSRLVNADVSVSSVRSTGNGTFELTLVEKIIEPKT